MSLRPLRQPPFLDNLGWRFENHEFAGDVAVENRKFITRLRSFKQSWCPSCESGDSLTIRKSIKHLLSCCPKFICGRDCSSVDRRFTGTTGGGCTCLCRSGVALLSGMPGWRCHTTRGIRIRRMLNVLAVFGDQGWSQRVECASKLGNNLGANKFFYGLLLLRLGINIYLKLENTCISTMVTGRPCILPYRHTTYSDSSVS